MSSGVDGCDGRAACAEDGVGSLIFGLSITMMVMMMTGIIEAEMHSAMRGVGHCQVTLNTCLLYTSPSPRDRG
eukprot:105441-Rhodomonas_salina.2